MNGNAWQEIAGNPISTDEAWRVLDDWRSERKEIGLLYCASSGSAVIAGMCRVRGLRNGMVQMKGEDVGASMNLKMAKFSYGPMQVWPRWPVGPAGEVLALQVFLPEGAWLVLAEGYVPRELAPVALPE